MSLGANGRSNHLREGIAVAVGISTNRVQPLRDVRQTSFICNAEEEPNRIAPPTAARRKRVDASVEVQHDLLSAVVARVVAETLQGCVQQLSKRLEAVEVALGELQRQSATVASAKEYYTTDEVAKILGKRRYTVREWCRLGRVVGEKAQFGRGQDNEWRISHAELKRIQSTGLLPIQNSADVGPARRLRKSLEDV